MDGRLVLAAEDPTTPDALALIRQASAELTARYDLPDDDSGDFSPGDVQAPRSAFLVARLDGCGALRPMAEPGFEDSAEIKRMYVAPDARGRRIGGLILDRLGALAVCFGYARVILETGDRQPEAIRLYERSGYAQISCYGAYLDDPHSVCLAKPLAASERT